MPHYQIILHIYHNVFGDSMRHVASLKCNPREPSKVLLEKAFRYTNNISDSWITNDVVDVASEVKKEGGCRSTSVGDIINLVEPDPINNSVWFKVAACGFEPIEEPTN